MSIWKILYAVLAVIILTGIGMSVLSGQAKSRDEYWQQAQADCEWQGGTWERVHGASKTQLAEYTCVLR